MAETKQISATIDLEIANDVSALSNYEERSFSQMVEMLLREALTNRTLNKNRNSKKKKQTT